MSPKRRKPTDVEAKARITAADIERAVKRWDEDAPQALDGLLDATPVVNGPAGQAFSVEPGVTREVRAPVLGEGAGKRIYLEILRGITASPNDSEDERAFRATVLSEMQEIKARGGAVIWDVWED